MLSPEAPLYNMPFRFDFYGEIDVERFINCFMALVKEADIMRATFHFDEDNLPIQEFNNDHTGEISFLDWSGKANSDEELVGLIEEKNTRIFDLEGILYESFLVKLKDDHFVWYLNQHHLITDAWGISVQYKRMAELYNDEGSPLPSFSNYIDAEQQVGEKKKHKKGRAYWDNELKDVPPLVSLYNYNASRQNSETTRIKLDLKEADLDALHDLLDEPDVQSFTSHISLLSLFLTGLFSYMYRVSGQRKLTIGTPAHNRATPDFQNTPGPFIEFFPIVAEIDEGESFGSLYQKVRKKVMGYLMHGQSGMANPELSASFNVVLNYIHAGFPDFNGVPVRSEWMHIGHCDPRHDLRMHVIDYKNDGRVQVMLDMNDQVFPPDYRENAVHHLGEMISAMIRDRGQGIEDVVMISDQERIETSQILSGESREVIDLMSELDRYLTSDNTSMALKERDRSWSYADLDKRIHELSSALLEDNQPGDHIAIYLPRSADLMATILACLRSGLTYIPIPLSYPKERAQFIIDNADANTVVTTKALGIQCSGRVLAIEEIMGVGEARPVRRPDDIPAYILYTSGSTGQPKGVVVGYEALCNYMDWAVNDYVKSGPASMPLFTSIGFDLTVTSCFLPLMTGGTLHIYPEPAEGPDLSILEVVKNEHINIMKLTPSHMEVIREKGAMPALTTMIVGGEDFRLDLARQFEDTYSGGLRMINEYGPTEATVGCITYSFTGKEEGIGSVPIGRPIQNANIRIVNSGLVNQPPMVSGEILIGGSGVAEAYWKDEGRTKEKFIDLDGEKYYRSGDLAYLDHEGDIHFQGRIDQQLKLSGRRIEPGEIAEIARTLEGVESAVVTLISRDKSQDEVINCVSCGLPSNFPGVEFNEENECSLCVNYASYAERVKDYFREMDDLKRVFAESNKHPEAEYDCMMLLSGGKDSTYALASLADMGLKVLAFTLDNGYISQGALDNAQRVCRALGVDHVFGRTDAMNAIFVDSLERHYNVCNGCFKTIYTLSTKIALEKKIPIIVTGLSRGQFFETRLTEELFWDDSITADMIDDIILNARKAYHQVDDAVNRLLDVSFYEDDSTFEKVKFVDFYRYCDVELSDLMSYLNKKLPWVRPKDTGRSTNCLINQLGIHVHKKTQGYSNYAFPYSWDVRIGHKNREESLDEINEVIDEVAVARMMEEIGYEEAPQEGEDYLTLFYTGDDVPAQQIKKHLERHLPDYMIPWTYVHVNEIPLTSNGKVDMDALEKLHAPSQERQTPYVEPETEIQKLLAEIWKEVLLIDKVGINDAFLELGGNSLMAIRVISRINKKFRMELSLNSIFKYPTIAEYEKHVEDTIRKLMST
jgi:amino acid adenylation domain-containing protein